MAKPTKKKKNKALINWIFFIVLLAVAGGVTWMSIHKTKQETRWTLQDYQGTDSTYMGDLDISILASATIHPFEIVEVRPEASGRIEELYIETGDWINEGDPIALLDQEDLSNRLASAVAELARAQANLDQVLKGYSPREIQTYESAIENARLALNEAIEDLDDVKELHQAGFASDEELDKAEYAVEQAQLAYDNSVEAMDVLLEGSTPEEIRSARAAVTIAQTNVTDAKNSLGDATIYSPITGRILDTYVIEGSVVVSTLASFSAGDAMCTIGDTSRMKALASVDENDIGLVKVGQKCNLTVDSYRDETFPGTVLKIHPQATQNGGVTVFTTEIEVPNDDDRLMSGMTCEVEVITEKITGLLLVADRAIVERDDKYYVFIVGEKDKIEYREIEIGRTNYEATEVLSGLELGDVVITQGVPRDLLDEVIGDNEKSDEEEGGVKVDVE